jgi:RNA polymerase sigma-70 factor (ECF subfamily)
MDAEFDALFDTCYSRLARMLYRVTGDTARAEEAASEAFWRLYRKPPRTRANIEAWLYRTALRAALDENKKSRRRARYESLASAGKVCATNTVEPGMERESVRQTLTALDADQVALILLRAEGLTYAELAAGLGLNPASVGTMLSRAEEAFRKEYVNRYGQR